MDSLFARYGNPFSLVDMYIQTRRFNEFIDVFFEQKAEQDRWEFFIHKVWNQTYDEFCNSLRASRNPEPVTEEDIETTVKNSMDILGNFVPVREEGEP